MASPSVEPLVFGLLFLLPNTGVLAFSQYLLPWIKGTWGVDLDATMARLCSAAGATLLYLVIGIAALGLSLIWAVEPREKLFQRAFIYAICSFTMAITPFWVERLLGRVYNDPGREMISWGQFWQAVFSAFSRANPTLAISMVLFWVSAWMETRQLYECPREVSKYAEKG